MDQVPAQNKAILWSVYFKVFSIYRFLFAFFVAVKCNNEPILLQSLASLGTGFDCASKTEIKTILDMGGVSPNNIVYANPCKPQSHIK